MTHSPLLWELTIALVVAMLLFDYFFHIRRAHVPTLPEAARWSAAYVGVALSCSRSAEPGWASSTSPPT